MSLEQLVGRAVTGAAFGYLITAGIYAIGEETYIQALQEPYAWKGAVATGLACIARDVVDYLTNDPKK